MREVVRRRVGKYMEAKHPARLVLSEAGQVYNKVVREVIGKEQQVCQGRRVTSTSCTY